MTFLEAHIIANTAVLATILFIWLIVKSIKKLCRSPTDRAFDELMKEIKQIKTIPGGPTLGCDDTCCDCTEF